MGTAVEHLRLRSQLRWWKWMTLLSLISTVILWWYVLQPKDAARFGLLRAKGIIVEDTLGRDRILIGAPFPTSAQRVRTDTAAVRAVWSERFGGDRYMEWYKDYRHDGVGMLVLNAEGYDRVLIGEQLPDPNTGVRIGSPTGVFWNDHEGIELGGLGALRLHEDSTYRNGLGLDDQDGEGMHLMILEDGSKMLRTVHPGGMLLQGRLAARGHFGDTVDFIGARSIGTDGSVKKEIAFE
ncbi:MAG: hypothetical protein JNN32_03825 [Flavobacteriales bacterium]|nr:hypothetical protein [Flavobacteriales bacterium]